jgi:hypothetical protein
MRREAADGVDVGFGVGRFNVAEDSMSQLNRKLGKEHELLQYFSCGLHRVKIDSHIWIRRKGGR